MYTCYVATILSSMCMCYFSHTWLDSVPHIRTLLQMVITLHWKETWPHDYGITRYTCQCLNHQKTVIIIWSFNCLTALEAKCCLCKGSDFIVHFRTCMLKHINTTMQVLTRITGLICNCLVYSLHSKVDLYI